LKHVNIDHSIGFEVKQNKYSFNQKTKIYSFSKRSKELGVGDDQNVDGFSLHQEAIIIFKKRYK